MKCSICKTEINDYGNNPFPLCAEEDVESRCCNDCNSFVIKARIMSMKKKTTPKIGDTLVIFWASGSSAPIDCIHATGKFLAGIIEEIKTNEKEIIYTGSWGNFPIKDSDSYASFD